MAAPCVGHPTELLYARPEGLGSVLFATLRSEGAVTVRKVSNLVSEQAIDKIPAAEKQSRAQSVSLPEEKASSEAGAGESPPGIGDHPWGLGGSRDLVSLSHLTVSVEPG